MKSVYNYAHQCQRAHTRSPPTSKPARPLACSLQTARDLTVVHDDIKPTVFDRFDVLPSFTQIVAQDQLGLLGLSSCSDRLQLL